MDMSKYQVSSTAKCSECDASPVRLILNPGAPVEEIRLGRAFIQHNPGCPVPAHVHNPRTPPGFMDMPIPPNSSVPPVTAAISPDNREELVSILRDGFKWGVRFDDDAGLVYTSPDRTTAVRLDDINDNDLTVTRYAPSPATAGPWDELWKVSMTASTPTRVMLAVAMGA